MGRSVRAPPMWRAIESRCYMSHLRKLVSAGADHCDWACDVPSRWMSGFRVCGLDAVSPINRRIQNGDMGDTKRTCVKVVVRAERLSQYSRWAER